jgi:hypothetical protein
VIEYPRKLKGGDAININGVEFIVTDGQVPVRGIFIKSVLTKTRWYILFDSDLWFEAELVNKGLQQ